MSSNTVIRTNIMSINAHNNMLQVGALQSRSAQKLSSGYRINSAADDASGLAISEKMRAQIRGLDMAGKNTKDAQALIQTAEGGMQEIDNMLQRIRELVVNAANDTNEQNFEGSGDRQKIQDEIDQLVQEIDSMADRTEFNKKRLVDGSFERFKLTSLKDAVFNAAATVNSAKLAIQNDKTVGAAQSVYNTAKAAWIKAGQPTASDAATFTAMKTAKEGLDTAISAMSTKYATLDTALKGYNTAHTALTDAMKASAGTAGTPLYFQVGANAFQGLTINIESVKSDVLGIGDGWGNNIIDVRRITGSDVTETINRIDKALTHVTTQRSKLGAAFNRLDYTQKSLAISSENISAAESLIRDTDMAKEMMNLTKANVLQQASISMLAQANQAPQSVLQLLQ